MKAVEQVGWSVKVKPGRGGKRHPKFNGWCCRRCHDEFKRDWWKRAYTSAIASLNRMSDSEMVAAFDRSADDFISKESKP